MNALKRIEGEEVGVTGDNVGREASDGEFEKLVVLRIPASSYSHFDIDPLSFARKGREKASNIRFIEISTDALSVENFVEFGERRKRKQNFSCLERQVESFAGL